MTRSRFIVGHRIRRVSAVAATVALAGVCVVVGFAVRDRLATAHVPEDGLIPWVDSPAEPPQHVTRRDPRPDRRPCLAADFQRPWSADGGTAGSRRSWTLLLPNGSDSRCTLTGSATLIGTDATTGVRTELPTVSADANRAGQFPATIDPGEPARLDLISSADCADEDATASYQNLALLVRGREFPLDHLHLATGCPIAVGSWYVQPPLLNAPVTVRLDVPAQVRRGQALEYTVTLRGDGRSFSLDPCPVYRQTLGGNGSYYRLNCLIDSVPPDEPAGFAMRLRVPVDAALGLTTLTWMAVMADGRVAIGDLATGGASVEVIA